ncbi:MAG: tetratricopeptide repeat protein, partial [Burkholderiaceae bacterium]|nr:tetratricopeptide repeat protein [Burkholderiaceae bacterium]
MDLSNAALQAVLDQIPGGASAELFDELDRLLGAALSQPGAETALIVDAAYEALRRASDEIVCAGRVSSLLSIVTHHYRAARPEAALAPAREAVRVARALGDPAWLRKALTYLGNVLSDTRDLPQAVECYAEAIEIARERADRTAECSLWVNTGLAHCYAARYAEALACFDRALEFGGAGASVSRSQQAALINIALCALHLNDVGRGLNAIQRYLKDAPYPESVEDLLQRSLLEHQYVRLLLQAGLVEQARERARLAREFATRSGSARADLVSTVAEGLAEIHAGAAEVGLARLKRSLERARTDVPGFLPDALAALIKGYEVAGQPDAALVYLRELKRLHQDGREAQVLMHHAQHVARVDAELDLRARGALDAQQSRLRGQLLERDIVRARVAMLEQHSVAAELHDDTTGEHCYRV